MKRTAATRTTAVLAVLAALAMLAALAGPALALQSPAFAAAAPPLYGHDVSWPQCPAGSGPGIPGRSYGKGFGNPLPPTDTGFVIVGLTDGLPFYRNHCLADQVAWVVAHDLPRGAYTMAAYPTPAQLSAYGSTGPRSGATLAGRLYNTGYAMARFDLASLRASGLAVPFVWIDVEPRPGASTPPNWPTTSPTDNRQVLLGLRAGLRAAGLGTGWYSTRTAWRAITGGWQDGDPMWKAGDYTTTGYPGALSICGTASLNGGPIWMGQRVSGSYDLDATCGALPSAATIFGATGTSGLTHLTASADSAPAASGSNASSSPVTFTATLGSYQAWTATIGNRCSGADIRQWTGTIRGTVSTTWDGRDSTGHAAPAGLYTFAVSSNGATLSTLTELVRPGVTALAGCPLTRVYGTDRYATAVAATRALFPAATTVVLAPGPDTSLVDGLVAAPLARTLEAPLLLTTTGALSPAAEADIRAHHVADAYVIGSAASSAVRGRLVALGVTVHPVVGADRYATSVAVAEALAAAGGGTGHTAFVGSGAAANLVDSLAAGGPAAGLGVPILLTPPTSLPAPVTAELTALGITRTYVLGSNAAVSPAVAAQLPGATRLGGTDRYGTALRIAQELATAGEVELVSGQQGHLVDGLPAGVAGRPVLLTEGRSLTPDVRAWLPVSSLASGRILGGPGVVHPAAVAALTGGLG